MRWSAYLRPPLRPPPPPKLRPPPPVAPPPKLLREGLLNEEEERWLPELRVELRSEELRLELLLSVLPKEREGREVDCSLRCVFVERLTEPEGCDVRVLPKEREGRLVVPPSVVRCVVPRPEVPHAEEGRDALPLPP